MRYRGRHSGRVIWLAGAIGTIESGDGRLPFRISDAPPLAIGAAVTFAARPRFGGTFAFDVRAV